MNNYDHNRRYWKIVVPHPVRINPSSTTPPFPDHSYLTVTMDDPHLNPGIVNEVVMRLNRELRYEVERSRHHSYQTGAWHLMEHEMRMPVTKPKHRCVKCSTEETKEFYEGLLDYYEQTDPELVEKEKKTCSSLGCLLERIKQNAYNKRD